MADPTGRALSAVSQQLTQAALGVVYSGPPLPFRTRADGQTGASRSPASCPGSPRRCTWNPLLLPSAVPKPLRVLPTSQASRWVTSANTCQVNNPLRPLTHSLGWASALLLNPKTAFSHSRSFPWLWFKETQGSSLVLHWLRLGASAAGGNGSIPGWGTKITQPKKKK